MDGVSLSTTRPLESFGSSKAATRTLSRLASLIARAESKPLARSQRQEVPHLSTYICSECGKVFSYASELLHHQEDEHTLPKPHRCPTCGQEFSLKSTLQLHKCEGDILLCEQCGLESRFRTSCPVCTAQTSDLGDSSEKSPHFLSKFLDSSPYTCAPCGKGFGQKQALLQHQQAGCNELPSPSDSSSLPGAYPCLDGDFDTFDSTDASLNCQTPETSSKVLCRLQLWRVCLPKTSRAKEQQPPTQRQRTKIECTGEATTSMNGQPQRMLRTKNKPLKCRSCNMVFKNTAKLYLHRQEKHIREKTQRSEPKLVTTKRRRKFTYPCQICGKVFFHHLSLRAHLRRHTAASFDNMTQDTSLSPAEANPGVADNKRARAGPGRPRKVYKLEEKERKEDKEEESVEEEEQDEAVEEQPGSGEEEEEVTEQNKEKEVEELGVEEPEEEEEEEEEESEFPCPSCAEIFSEQWQLLEHTELHQSSMQQRHCSVCTNQIEARKWPRSKRHRLYHCIPCQKGFSAMDCFLEHCQEHLRARVEEDSIAEGYA